MVSPRRIAVLMHGVPGEQAPAGDRPAGAGLRGRLRRGGHAHQSLRGLRPGQGRLARRPGGAGGSGAPASSTTSPAARAGRPPRCSPTSASRSSATCTSPRTCAGAIATCASPGPSAGWWRCGARRVIPFGIAGLTSGRTSHGHRWLGGPVEIARPARLRGGDAVGRGRGRPPRARAAHLGASWSGWPPSRAWRSIDPSGKMEEVLFLVEWPTVAQGLFAHRHLALPAEVLVTAMQSHQRYFPLVDETGALSNRFLYVSNGDPAWTKQITAGQRAGAAGTDRGRGILLREGQGHRPGGDGRATGQDRVPRQSRDHEGQDRAAGGARRGTWRR